MYGKRRVRSMRFEVKMGYIKLFIGNIIILETHHDLAQH